MTGNSRQAIQLLRTLRLSARARTCQPVLTRGCSLRLPTTIRPEVGVSHVLPARFLSTAPPRDIKAEITGLVNESKVVVFMKGVPEAPRCGFSNAVVQIMRMHDVPFFAHNVLDDEELRQGIKDFSSWPTIPQIFLNGEFVGGCDILLQMHQSGELVEELEKIGITSALVNAEKK